MDYGSSVSSFPNNGSLGTHVYAAIGWQTGSVADRRSFYLDRLTGFAHTESWLCFLVVWSLLEETAEKDMCGDAGPDCSEFAGGFEILGSLGLSPFTEFMTGSSCFIPNSRGESGQGAGCSTCMAEYLPLTSFQPGHRPPALCWGSPPHLSGTPGGGDGDETAQAEQLLQSQGVFGAEVLAYGGRSRVGGQSPWQRLKSEATLLLGVMGQDGHAHSAQGSDLWCPFWGR